MSDQTVHAKHCTKCGEIKPLTEYCLDKRNKDGRGPWCLSCNREIRKKNYNANPEPKRAKNAEWYKENKEKFRERRNETTQAWRAANREHYLEQKREKAAEYRKEFPERIRQSNKQWRLAHPEDARIRASEWRKANPERGKESHRAWYKANPFYHKLAANRRRALKRKAEGIFTKEQVTRRFDQQTGRCAWCSEQLADLHHIDHLIPLAKGGSNWINNIVISCVFCNSSKRHRLPFEQWYPPNPIIFVCELAHERLLEYHAQIDESRHE